MTIERDWDLAIQSLIPVRLAHRSSLNFAGVPKRAVSVPFRANQMREGIYPMMPEVDTPASRVADGSSEAPSVVDRLSARPPNRSAKA